VKEPPSGCDIAGLMATASENRCRIYGEFLRHKEIYQSDELAHNRFPPAPAMLADKIRTSDSKQNPANGKCASSKLSQL